MSAVMSDNEVARVNTRPYGPYAGELKDNLYLIGCGHIYTTPSVVARVNTRFSADIALTLNSTDLNLKIGGHEQCYGALAIRPGTERYVESPDVQLISINVNPDHSMFRRFQLLPSPGVLRLDRSLFDRLDPSLKRAFDGTMQTDEALHLQRQAYEIASQFLPKVEPLDPRVRRILDCIEERGDCSLPEIAGLIHLSYKRASLLFAQQVGLPLKSYLLWKKLQRYQMLAGKFGRGRSITQIAHAAGFVDSSHLCRTFQEIYGAPPSYFFANEAVRVKSWLRNGPMSPRNETGIDRLRSFDWAIGAMPVVTT